MESAYENPKSDVQSYHEINVQGHELFIDEPYVGKLALDFDKYVNTIAGFILFSKPQYPIGIFGGWGTGKTTLLRNIQKKLEDNSIETVEFDAWRYQNEADQIVIPLTITVLKKIQEMIEKNHALKNNLNKLFDQKESLKEKMERILGGLSLDTTIGIPGVSVGVNYDFSRIQERKSFFSFLKKDQEKFYANQTNAQEGIDLIKKLCYIIQDNKKEQKNHS